eukprot:TRINITY_DN65487_c10_g13_i1.p1 TRINITY_DN65487_c10_g13~~TRINITY_DN65487_c10_g13_i1.p1  ORF type:complete len:512 (+),score=284.57 TRINITY_DN65487_c10_g13_i1:511-2046(+)
MFGGKKKKKSASESSSSSSSNVNSTSSKSRNNTIASASSSSVSNSSKKKSSSSAAAAAAGGANNSRGSSGKKKASSSSSSSTTSSSRHRKNKSSSSSSNVAHKMSKMRIDESKAKESGSSNSSSGGGSGSRSHNAISYAAERVIGNGSFGVVYEAMVVETKHKVAIKKVLQDRRFKNRELQIMRELNHPNVVTLHHSFLAKGDSPDEIFLNLVMEFIPETIHRALRSHNKAKKLINMTFVKVYMYQICRALGYIHGLGICHRDIKPQNLLLNSKTHQVKLCDFGSAKVLVKGKQNVAYICSRFYRAPELVFEATEYTTAIDVWSLGCVMAEMLLGKPLFPGESGVDQLIEIIKVLGTPTREEIKAMNPHHTTFTFPQISPHPWSKVFRHKVPKEGIDLVSRFLTYKPKKRIRALEALAHPFFDELRKPSAKLPNGHDLPPLFNFTDKELDEFDKLGITSKVLPSHLKSQILANRGSGKPVQPRIDIFKMNPSPPPSKKDKSSSSSKKSHHK